MQITVKKLPKSEVEIEGELNTDLFENYFAEALKKIGEKLEIDGFRKGKIPESVLVSKIPEISILEKMAELALGEHYPKITEKEKLDVIGRPEISITKLARKNPLGFKIKTAVLPEIKLPDYKAIAKKIISLGHSPTGEAKITDAEKENQAKEKTRLKIIEKIIEESLIDIPEILIEIELDKILYRMESDITQMGLKFEDYLKHLNKTKEDLRKDFRKDGEAKVKLALVLNEISKVEKIVADEENIAKEVAHILEHYKDADPERARMHAENVLTNEKIFRFLETQ
ncbi:hypothetical protein A3B85_02000 [Candidatus Nomurabacteria bacterium RIFCSPHIGHO2_02_FULL_37_13]|uniref:Uncharacterized protein n=1 Tax=Candidatus Nomurabacteria bacterium RIFCSPHIGHO2_02_FULL_37_13 TaxID=1801750 RepID=A0A1F6W4U5_9BACT|nr:MAG: hypothetical protein A2640_00770 [Candidatus Nomurabacteria bacterium RIFCSPHIGHO2_01_FULL_36_23]OGI76864.1 MAG: hypothetical protein A3B85_02000 [Candidatus Nomurabacteria bacterium RIFCSPHIGHO2_02_FULL_37_13]OGI87835.1 MAG: hypothetical protein A2906_02275 [Candidatus Nomurabacteria bacterium RIFCSPLOWO2_01_FULL_37_25]